MQLPYDFVKGLQHITQMRVILDNIRSMNNVGSIFRTADALGVEKIYLCGITPEPLDPFGRPRPQFVKISLGAEKTVAWEYAKSAGKLIDKLKKAKPRSELRSATGEGYKIFAVEQNRKSIPYYKIKPFDKAQGKNQNNLVLIFGNEVDGISPAILKKCDKILEIPMRGAMVRQAHHPRRLRRGKESLNVAVSFGIVAFQIMYNQ